MSLDGRRCMLVAIFVSLPLTPSRECKVHSLPRASEKAMGLPLILLTWTREAFSFTCVDHDSDDLYLYIEYIYIIMMNNVIWCMRTDNRHCNVQLFDRNHKMLEGSHWNSAIQLVYLSQDESPHELMRCCWGCCEVECQGYLVIPDLLKFYDTCLGILDIMDDCGPVWCFVSVFCMALLDGWQVPEVLKLWK